MSLEADRMSAVDVNARPCQASQPMAAKTPAPTAKVADMNAFTLSQHASGKIILQLQLQPFHVLTLSLIFIHRGPPKGYIDSLESKLGKFQSMETALQDLLTKPNATLDRNQITALLKDVKVPKIISTGFNLPTPSEHSPAGSSHLNSLDLQGLEMNRTLSPDAFSTTSFVNNPPSAFNTTFPSPTTTSHAEEKPFFDDSPRVKRRVSLLASPRPTPIPLQDRDASPWRSDTATSSLPDLEQGFGTISLNENDEFRFHGRSSGLDLISQSAHHKDSFWKMPPVAGVAVVTPVSSRVHLLWL